MQCYDYNISSQYTHIIDYNDIIYNILLYSIFICVIYIILKVNYISKKIENLAKMDYKMDLLYNKNIQVDKDIKYMKSKSLDNIDTTIVLRRRSENLENELNLLKYNNWQNNKQIDLLKEKFAIYKK